VLPPGEIISSYGLYVKDIKKMSNNKKIGAVALQTSLQMTRSLQTSCLTHSNPWFITGFADAEGSFSILIQRVQNNKIGFKIHAIFSIGLHNGGSSFIRND
jgi:hypothetical protein